MPHVKAHEGNPSELPPPPEPRLEIIPLEEEQEIKHEREIIDGLLDDKGALPWIRPDRPDVGQA